MATYNLRRFSHVDGIKGIGREHLLAVLEPHGEYLCTRGVRLPDAAGLVPIPYQDLIHVLMTPDATTPREMANAFYLIHEMATPQGMDGLLNEAAKRGLRLDGAPDSTPADVATQVYLRDRGLLEEKHAQQYGTRLRSFKYFHTDVAPLPKTIEPSALSIVRLEDEVNDWFVARKRGREAKVLIFPEEDEICFMVRHGDPVNREGTVHGGETSDLFFRPEKYDVLVYDVGLGEIRVNGCSDAEREMYRRAFGRHIFGSEDFFPGIGKYTLDPIRLDGSACCACTDVDGLEWVRLKEVHFHWGGQSKEVEVRKAEDVFAAYVERGTTMPSMGRIMRASFLVKFEDCRKARTVTILPSNLAQYTRDGDCGILEEWMTRRGFIVAAEGVTRVAA